MRRSRLRELPPRGNSSREIIVGGLTRISRRLLNREVRKIARGKTPHEDALNDARRQIVLESNEAVQKSAASKLNEDERNEMHQIVRKIFTSEMTDDESKKIIDRIVIEMPNPGVLLSAIDEADVATDLRRRGFIGFARYLKQHPQMFQRVMNTIGYAIILSREFRAHGLPASITKVYHELAGAEIVLSKSLISQPDRMKKFMQTMKGIENKIINESKSARSKVLARRQAANKELQTIRQKWGRFELSRSERRQMWQEVRKQLVDGSNHLPASALERGFKRARKNMRDKLTRAGVNPDSVFEVTGIAKSTPEGAVPLRVLTTALRSAKTDGEISRVVERVKNHYLSKRKKSANAAPSPLRPAPAINPIKQATKIERAARQRAAEAAATVPKPKSSNGEKKFPTTAGGFASLFGKEKRVTDEMAVALNNFLQGVRPRQYPDAQIDQLMEHQILTIIATQFQKSGRVSDTGLRQLTTPPLLVEHFKRALRSLIKKGYLEYESHAGSSEFVSITNASASKILGKYNTKIARQHENGN